MTTLQKPVTRATVKPFAHYRRQIVITLIPGTESRDELIGFRLKGTRETMLARVADLYRMAALWHGQKKSNARRAARKASDSALVSLASAPVRASPRAAIPIASETSM